MKKTCVEGEGRPCRCEKQCHEKGEQSDTFLVGHGSSKERKTGKALALDFKANLNKAARPGTGGAAENI